MGKKKRLYIGIVVILILLLTQCAGGKKSVAIDFAEASMVDANAKKAVSLMSEDYLDQMLDRYDAPTKKVLISNMQDSFDNFQDEMVENYGKRWKAKVEYIDGYTEDDGRYFVVLNITFKGTGGLLGLKDLEETTELSVALVKEGGKWRVDDLYE